MKTKNISLQKVHRIKYKIKCHAKIAESAAVERKKKTKNATIKYPLRSAGNWRWERALWGCLVVVDVCL